MTLARWRCSTCGIVRDVDVLRHEGAPWCRHNAMDLSATRMDPIKPWHPFAEGPLPWGESDPASGSVRT